MSEPDPHLWGKQRRPQRNRDESDEGWRFIRWLAFMVALAYTIDWLR